MFAQLNIVEMVTALPSSRCALLALSTVAMAVFSAAEYDTVWDLSNRVCDRYLPEVKEG